jgi:cytochrome c oxidase assembly protein subunit 15
MWPLLTLLVVCLQGAFGALTVTMKLFPAIVTLHLMGGLLLLVMLAAQASRYALSLSGRSAAPVSLALYGAVLAVGVLLTAQIALGGWVSTNYAVLACQEFPTCQGSWWPSMDFEQGFTLWRELGMTTQGQPIPFEALTAIHYVHRLMALAVLLALLALAWRLFCVPALQPQAKVLAGLALLQLVTGLSNVVLDWPLLAALAHTGGAAALSATLVWTLNSCRPLSASASSSRSHATRLTA